jgi:hypothetical protein
MNFLLKLTILIFSNQAQAFDKIDCVSNLGNWSVVNKSIGKNVVLNKKVNRISLLENESSILTLIDENKEAILKIYPWDGIDLVQKNKLVKYTLETDKISWFRLVFPDHGNTLIQCRLSFRDL